MYLVRYNNSLLCAPPLRKARRSGSGLSAPSPAAQETPSGSSEAQSPLEGNRSKHALKRLSVLCGSQPRTFIEAQL